MVDLYQKQVQLGKAGEFLPHQNITRLDLIRYLVQALGEGCRPDDPGCPADLPFTDIKPHEDGYAEVAWAFQQGWLTPDSHFRPNAATLRAEAAKIFIQALEDQAPQVDPQSVELFDDVQDEDEWFFLPVYQSREAGLFNGYQDNRFLPGGVLTRAEAVQVIYNFLKINKSE